MVYIREPDGSLVARFEPGENPVADYYYFDGLGSTVMLTQGLSTITDRYDYDAWGNEYPIMVSTADNPYRYVGQLGYYTHWMDSSLTDLLHLGVRFYEPGVGRFGQTDFAQDSKCYSYAWMRPTAYVDPDGERPQKSGAGGVVKWVCKIFPNLWFCKNVYKPYTKVLKCKQAFDCTKCASDMVAAALACTNPPEDTIWEISQPPYNGNTLKWKMACVDRVAKKYKGQPNLVDCLTKCAEIPIDWLGGITPGRL